MFKSQLIQTISRLTDDEIGELKLFVCSPYHNRSSAAQDYVNLLDFIAKHIHSADQEADLDKDKAYKALYPNKEIIKGKLDKTMSGLMKLLQAFVMLTYNEAANKTAAKQLALATFYREKQMQTRFEGMIEALKDGQKEIPFHNADYFFTEYQISNEIYQYQDARYTKKGELNLPEVVQNLDLFYLTRKLSLVLAWVYAKKFVNAADYDAIAIFSETMPIFLARDVYNIPIINIFTKAIEVANTATANDVNYQEFYDLLEKYQDELPSRLMKDFQAYLRSYCVSQYNHGRESFLHIGFELFKKHLERGYYFLNNDNKLSHSQFQALVATGLKAGDSDWVKWFLQTYKSNLQAFGYEEGYFNFNMANYYFHIKKYDKALNLLLPNYPDTNYTFAAKRMEIKIYYELQSDLLDTKIETFKVYIHRLSKKSISNLYS